MTHLMNPLLATPLAIASRHGVSIQALNSECFCVSLDTEALRRALQAEMGPPDLFALVRERCPYVFAARPVFVSHVVANNNTKTFFCAHDDIFLTNLLLHKFTYVLEANEHIFIYWNAVLITDSLK